MKKLTMKMAMLIAVLAISFKSFGQVKNKRDDQKVNKNERWQEQDSTWGYRGNYNDFRKYNDSVFNIYDKRIDSIRKRQGIGGDMNIKSQLDSLGMQSSALRNRINGYNEANGEAEWKTFRDKYNRDLRNLDRSIMRWNQPSKGQMDMKRDSL